MNNNKIKHKVVLAEYDKTKDAYKCRDTNTLEIIGYMFIVDNIKYFITI
jgi:hypothetical protein